MQAHPVCFQFIVDLKHYSVAIEGRLFGHLLALFGINPGAYSTFSCRTKVENYLKLFKIEYL